MKLPELKQIAKSYFVRNYSNMSKDLLIENILEKVRGKFSVRNSPIIRPPEKLLRRSSGSK